MTAELPPGHVYTGDSDVARPPSQWLSSEDIVNAGDRVEAMIAVVKRHPLVTFQDGDTIENVLAVYFVHNQFKPWLLTTKTNRITLRRAFGKHVLGWVARRVLLFTVPAWNPKIREMALGVRVKPIIEEA